MSNKTLKALDEVLSDWAVHAPADMADEPPRDKILDSFLRLFDSFAEAGIRQLPPMPELCKKLAPAIRWQWVALNIPGPPVMVAMAPHVLTLAAARWSYVWQNDKSPGKSKLMATMDKDLEKIHAAAQYVLQMRRD